MTFRQGDVGALPYEDDTFDIVLSLNGFHAFPDKEAAYREVFRVLRPGGTFCGCFYVMGEHKRTTGSSGASMKRRGSSHRLMKRPSV